MGRLKRQLQNEYQTDDFNPDLRYDLAYKRVKRIKGFYVHALVYVLVNSFIIISFVNGNSDEEGDLRNWETYSTALFWGIGLLAHGLSVFGRNIFFGPNWEENKIKELMEKEKKEKWQ